MNKFTTVVIKEKQPVLECKPMMILLSLYNKHALEKLYITEHARTLCWSSYMEYTFYKEVGDMPGHYIQGNTLRTEDALRWFALEMNKND